MRRACLAFFLQALVASFCSTWVVAESGEESPSAEHTPSLTEEQVEALRQTKGDRYIAGVYFGWVYTIHPELPAVSVRMYQSLDEPPRFRRQLFHFDKKTRVQLKGFRSRKIERLREGDKVAVRFFGEGSFFLADEIYLVEGEFKDPRFYRKKVKRKKKSEDESEESKDKTPAASHGDATKKSAGGH